MASSVFIPGPINSPVSSLQVRSTGESNPVRSTYETSVRPYVTTYPPKTYTETLKAVPAKSFYNKIIVANPAFREFLGDAQKRALRDSEKAWLNYLKQSERKKPYLGDPYSYMEYVHESPPGITPEIPVEPGDPGDDPGYYEFNFDAIGSWCPDDTSDIIYGYGTHPIYGLTVTFSGGSGPVTIVDVAGLGTPNVTFKLTCGPNVSGMITIEASMIAYPGVPGDSNDNLYEGDCACGEPPALTWDYALSPETISRSSSVSVYVSGGVGPYTWSIAGATEGSGLTLTDAVTAGVENTLTASSTACGSAEITVTDYCGQVVTAGVRVVTYGTWKTIDTSTCVFYGEPVNGSGWTSTGIQAWTGYRVVGNQRNRQYLHYSTSQSKDFGSPAACEAARLALYYCGIYLGIQCLLWCDPRMGEPPIVGTQYPHCPNPIDRLYYAKNCTSSSGLDRFARQIIDSWNMTYYKWRCS